MKYWQNIITKEIVEADTSSDHRWLDDGWLWVEVFCTGLDPLRCDDPACPVHGRKK